MNELRGIDLCFRLEETQAFLTHLLGDELAHQIVFALEEWTGGWIAVVRLAVLSLHGVAHPATLLERLGSQPDRSLSRYLLEEILFQQTPAVQELLEQMSMLEQWCTDLCVAISGDHFPREQMQAPLDWLERSNLFLVPLDNRQG